MTSQHHVGVLARALPPVLKCGGVVRRQLGVADAMIEARGPNDVSYPVITYDGARDADARLPLQKGHAPWRGLFSGALGMHHGGLQCAGPMAWSTALCVWLRAPLDR